MHVAVAPGREYALINTFKFPLLFFLLPDHAFNISGFRDAVSRKGRGIYAIANIFLRIKIANLINSIIRLLPEEPVAVHFFRFTLQVFSFKSNTFSIGIGYKKAVHITDSRR